MRELGLHLQAGKDYEVADFDDDAMINEAAEMYYQLRRRRGLARNYAVAEMRRNTTLIGATLVRRARRTGCCAAPPAPMRRTWAMSPMSSACRRAPGTSPR